MVGHHMWAIISTFIFDREDLNNAGPELCLLSER